MLKGIAFSVLFWWLDIQSRILVLLRIAGSVMVSIASYLMD